MVTQPKIFFSNVQNKSWFMDFDIEFEDDQFKCKGNKMVFACQSKYFDDKLYNGEDVVIIQNGDGIKSKKMVMEAVTKFFIFGEIDFEDDLMDDLMKFVKLIDHENLFQRCVIYMINNLNLENFITFHQLASRYGVENLVRSIRVFSGKNFNKIYKGKLFLEMEAEFMETILKADIIDMEEEQQMFLMLEEWLEHDLSSRMDFYDEFIKLIRMRDLDTEFLENRVNSQSAKYGKPGYDKIYELTPKTPRRKPLNIEEIKNKFIEDIETPEEFLELTKSEVIDVLNGDDLINVWEEIKYSGVRKWIEHDKESREGHLIDLLQCIRWREFPIEFMLKKFDDFTTDEDENNKRYLDALKESAFDFIRKNNRDTLVVVGNSSEANSKKVEIFNNATNKWQLFFNLGVNVSFCSAVIFEDNLIVVGSLGRGKSAEVQSLNLNTRQLTQLPSLNEKRYLPTVTVIDGNIYVCGGDSGSGYLNSLEIWNPSETSWKLLSSMKYKRFKHSAVEWEGKLYIFGGRGEGGHFDSVEIYNPKTDKWTEGASMPQPLISFTANAVKDLIYLIGGDSTDLKFVKSVNVYNPKSDLWMSSIDMPEGFYAASSITVKDKILISGGLGRNNYINVCEFDPVENTWKFHSKHVLDRGDHNIISYQFR